MIPTVGGLAQRVFRILSYSKLLLERRVMKPDGTPPPPPPCPRAEAAPFAKTW